jgi:hypothetical protein
MKIYKTTILSVVLYSCETFSFTLKEEPILGVFENGCCEEYLEPRGRNRWEAREDYKPRNFKTRTFHQILLGPSSQRE